MHRHLAILPLALLALAACGTPDPAATVGQPQPTVAPEAVCQSPLPTPSTPTPFAYPGPGTPFPTYPPPTPISTVDPQAIPEQTAPLGLGSAPRLDDQAAALGAFMVMPHVVAGHELEVADVGPTLIEERSMYLGYGRRTQPSMQGPTLIQLSAERSSGDSLSYMLGKPTLRRDGQVLWAEMSREEPGYSEDGSIRCYPVAELIWTTATSEIVFTIRSDSVQRRDLLLRAYLDTLKTAPLMRPLAPRPTPPTPTATPDSFPSDPVAQPTSTVTPTP